MADNEDKPKVWNDDVPWNKKDEQIGNAEEQARKTAENDNGTNVPFVTKSDDGEVTTLGGKISRFFKKIFG